MAEGTLRLTYLESPYAGKVEEERWANVDYARRAMRDSILRGESPIASHLLYTQPGILRDEVAEERALGMGCGFAWAEKAAANAFYVDRGISPGMEAGIRKAVLAGRKVEVRSLEADYAVKMRRIEDAVDVVHRIRREVEGIAP